MTATVRLLFRADAAFAKPELYDYRESKHIGYAIRLPSNQVPQRDIAHRLVRPTEWPSPPPIVSYHDSVYQAQSWDVSRRVVAKMEWRQGELFPRVGFIVTNLSLSAQRHSPLLQRPGHGGAMDKGRQIRPELDQVVVSQVRDQSGQAGTFRTGLQPG